MGNRTYALITGLFVLILTTTIGIIGYWLSDTGTETIPYVVVTQGNVSGLSESSSVLYRGVLAGRVETIRFSQEDIREILILIRINSDIPVSKGTYATLRLQGITGLSQLELTDKGTNPEPLLSSEERPARISLEPGFFDRISASFETLVANLDKLIADLSGLLVSNRGHIDGILANLELVTARANTLADQLETTLEGFPELRDEFRATLVKTGHLITDISEYLPRLDDISDDIDQLTATGVTIGERINASTLPRLEDTLAELAATGRQLQRLVKKLEDDPQSLLLGHPASPPGPGEPGYKE